MFTKRLNLNRAIALRTTIHLFLCIGFISTVAFILSAHWLLILAALPVCAFAWFVLYHFEKGIALWGGANENESAAYAPGRVPPRVPKPTAQEPEPTIATAPVLLPLSAEQLVNLKEEPVQIAWPELLR